MRLIASRASSGMRPNLDPTWPVACDAWVDASTPGITRTRQGCRVPAGTMRSSRSMSSKLSTTISPAPRATASSSSSSVLALPCRTSRAGSAPAFSALKISPAPHVDAVLGHHHR
jgi:hypothetical protein